MSSDDEKTDYNILLGFVTPAERIDPHVHDVTTPSPPDLREVVEIVRKKRDQPYAPPATSPAVALDE